MDTHSSHSGHDENVYDALSTADDDGRWAFGTGFDAGDAEITAPAPEGVDRADLATYCLMLADDALIASQRLAGWTAKAPELEEEVALANIALDLLGQARVLLSRAGHLGAAEPFRAGPWDAQHQGEHADRGAELDPSESEGTAGCVPHVSDSGRRNDPTHSRARCASSWARSTHSRVRAWVASRTTGGATPPSSASCQRLAHRHQRSPGFSPGKPASARVRSLPRSAE